ncbi:MAG: hypothetical protein OJF55_001282 [Rhodanobacteraceae bacterium]|jgi:hypothetical protein|nr:MAG: hypothetical protein OJF55_001282 [Rhodanobacteraceae bacterium]
MRCVGNIWRLPLAATTLILCGMATAGAHAIAGQRLFPSTLSFDDPGIGAELPLVFSHIRADGAMQNGLDIAVTKPVTQNFSLIAGSSYTDATSQGTPTLHGWGNFALGGVWQVYRNADAESIGSFSLSRSFAHTGSRAVRDDFSTWSPAFNFGKGFGQAGANWLRPFALTGSLGLDLPNRADEPRMLNWALSLQYSIPYLQDFVKYAGIKAPFDRMIPIVELPMQTCLDRGCRGQTTGYVAPGVIRVGRRVQWGVELLAPVNRRTGHSIGVMLGFNLYLDDLAPHGFGAPLFR